MSSKTELFHGLKMNGDDFHELYLRSDLRKVELLGGRVKMPSPVRFCVHSEPQMDLQYWIRTYILRTRNVRAGTQATVKLDEKNHVQPDVLMFKVPGNCTVDSNDYIIGSPEFVAEVAASSEERDSVTKLNMYLEFGIKEYLIYKSLTKDVCWYHLSDGRYQQILPIRNVIRSREFAGLCLDVQAFIEGDLQKVIRTLNDEMDRRLE